MIFEPPPPSRLPETLRRSLASVLADAIAIDGATKGNVQLVDRGTKALRIVVQSGFDGSFLETFETVSWDDESACGRAYRLASRVMIPDVAVDKMYAPFAEAARRAGYVGVQSTPILGGSGEVIGVMSTHFPRAHELSADAGWRLDLLACDAARELERTA